MRIEDQVCSLELAMRLKELGVGQEGCFSWLAHRDGSGTLQERISNLDNSPDVYYAFSVAELGEMFPYMILKDGAAYVVTLPCTDGMKETSKSGGYRDFTSAPRKNDPVALG